MTEQNLMPEETEYPTTEQKQRVSLLSRLSPKVIVAGVLIPAAAILGIIAVDIATPNPLDSEVWTQQMFADVAGTICYDNEESSNGTKVPGMGTFSTCYSLSYYEMVEEAQRNGIEIVDDKGEPVAYLHAKIYDGDFEPTEGWTPPAYAVDWLNS